ncbi:MAG: PfkB family carbohydrate kinase [Pleomorphochaeta sp.]
MKVIGVGDNVVDKYNNRGIMYPGGNALNFSVYSKMLGIDSAYLGIFGTDFAGQYVRNVVTDMGLDISHCKNIDGENGFACVDIIDGDRNFIDSNHGGVSRLYPLDLKNEDLDYLCRFDLIHSSINSFGFQKFLRLLNERELVVSFDFSSRFNDENLKELGKYINYAICSCGHISVEDTKELIKKIMGYGYDGILATRGIEGSFFADKGGVYFSPSDMNPAKDTLGAGDSFCTYFLTNYISHINNNISLSQRDRDKKIKEDLEKAAHFATKICMLDGAFNHGTQIQ